MSINISEIGSFWSIVWPLKFRLFSLILSFQGALVPLHISRGKLKPRLKRNNNSARVNGLIIIEACTCCFHVF